MPKYSAEDCSSVFLKYEIVGARAIFCILALISYENKHFPTSNFIIINIIVTHLQLCKVGPSSSFIGPLGLLKVIL